MATRLVQKMCKMCNEIYPQTEEYFRLVVKDNKYNEYGKVILYKRYSQYCLINKCYQKSTQNNWKKYIDNRKKMKISHHIDITSINYYTGPIKYFEKEKDLINHINCNEKFESLTYEDLSIEEQLIFKHGTNGEKDVYVGSTSSELTVGDIITVKSSTKKCIRGIEVR